VPRSIHFVDLPVTQKTREKIKKKKGKKSYDSFLNEIMQMRFGIEEDTTWQ
jgi:hypothetical protein